MAMLGVLVVVVTGGSGNGFDQKIIGDGKFTSGPNNGKADGGAKDPPNYLWNDEFNQYTVAQAGTPYTTAGRGNVYEFDTLCGDSLPVGSVPEASSIATWVLLVAAAAFVRSAHRAIRR